MSNSRKKPKPKPKPKPKTKSFLGFISAIIAVGILMSVAGYEVQSFRTIDATEVKSDVSTYVVPEDKNEPQAVVETPEAMSPNPPVSRTLAADTSGSFLAENSTHDVSSASSNAEVTPQVGVVKINNQAYKPEQPKVEETKKQNASVDEPTTADNLNKFSYWSLRNGGY